MRNYVLHRADGGQDNVTASSLVEACRRSLPYFRNQDPGELIAFERGERGKRIRVLGRADCDCDPKRSRSCTHDLADVGLNAREI